MAVDRGEQEDGALIRGVTNAMGQDPELEQRHDLEWMVTARNRIQSLMLRLLQNWDSIPSWRRQTALAVAFSLWRAVFLLIKDPDQSLDRVDVAAKGFLDRVVRRNTIAFSDDLTMRSWTSVYYVENAILRLQRDISDYDFVAYGSSPIGTVRDAWNEAFGQLDRLVPGSATASPLPHDLGKPKGGVE